MEKSTRIPCSGEFMQRVRSSHFIASSRLDELTGEVENLFGASAARPPG